MKVKVLKKIFIIVLIVFACTCVNVKVAYAKLVLVDVDDGGGGKSYDLKPSEYEVEITYNEGKKLFDMTAPIVKVLTNIGIVLSVIVITIIGLQYMIGSTIEQKVQIKEKMVPVFCGCLLIIGTCALVKIIASI